MLNAEFSSNFILMKKTNPITAGLAPQLFWDVDTTTLDWDRHASLIVERVIERGTFKNLQLLEQIYRKDKITDIIKNIPYLHPKDIAFVQTYFRIPLNDLKCYTIKRLNQHYSA
jgi:hypothetical protein